MAWIEVSADVETHPKTMKLQDHLPLSDRETLGLLCTLWFYALRHGDADGLLKGVTPPLLARVLRSPPGNTGEVEALIAAGFLDETEQGLRVHNWRRYSGRLAEKKMQARERTKKWRIERVTDNNDNHCTRTVCECDALQDTTVQNSTQQDSTEEDRTAQDSLHGGEAAGAPRAPGGRKPVPYSEEFERFWKQYPRKVAKPDAAKAFKEKVKPEDMDALMTGVEAWNREDQWLRDGGRYIPHAATFLRREQWKERYTPDRPEEEFRPLVETTNLF